MCETFTRSLSEYDKLLTVTYVLELLCKTLTCKNKENVS